VRAPDWLFALLADLVLIVHVTFVVFVIGGLMLIWLGRFCGWSFVRNGWFRLTHLAAIGIVAAEALTGLICPLTTWENQLRQLAGSEARYAGSFMQHWLHQVLFFDADANFFKVAYLIFFLAVALSLWLVPPRLPRRRAN
jgi:hypothetical protein